MFRCEWTIWAVLHTSPRFFPNHLPFYPLFSPTACFGSSRTSTTDFDLNIHIKPDYFPY
ncbi:hypothetical protein HanRHA438_Chr08g0370071 [Helianthus annuus]|uniref:Uncharacterized protein n=1 Tax=Helianthus annuus TaxID=4232 RepID=A0A251U611_HELAN|nr:hypothetical protein HanXRQr2_Chr08g0357991 [Helianthus annuus]KAJ0540208.1 hypothetical protein HanHA300_Chr08g0295611 [Helianthus annuus]KAJ0554952.1 hypothetical protein HanHA89_Chr08g0314121 [Helianthus annuus]KAJ0720520.1 hypothetical protein HanLR1_Chr08g0294481 [Helianthus annuus]KAJ0723717.1 hypothetical protein HanOQP8_Chr08g0301661 [Helianthus annuus]